MLQNGKAFMMIKKHRQELVFDIHTSAITELHGKQHRFQTYVKDGDKRKLVVSSDYEKLIDKLFQFYYEQNGTSSLTMDQIFHEWLDYKQAITNSMKTIRRHEQHWNKYFSAIKSKKISSYDRLELQKECNLLVKNNNLSSKEWQNIKTILSGIFDYATEKHYILENFMLKIKITVKFRQVNKKSGKTETFQTEEFDRLMDYLNTQYAITGDIALMAVKFDFYVGCRLGELVALKWSDCIDLNHLHICREELKESVRNGDKWHDVYSVADHTKTHSDRFVALVPMAVSILNELRLKTAPGDSEDGFIFSRNGERLTSRQFNYVLEKAEAKLGFPVTKRSHKIRKTVASRLNAGNVPLDSIREMLGHSNLSTTLGYIYNPLTEKETYALMTKAL